MRYNYIFLILLINDSFTLIFNKIFNDSLKIGECLNFSFIININFEIKLKFRWEIAVCPK